MVSLIFLFRIHDGEWYGGGSGTESEIKGHIYHNNDPVSAAALDGLV